MRKDMFARSDCLRCLWLAAWLAQSLSALWFSGSLFPGYLPLWVSGSLAGWLAGLLFRSCWDASRHTDQSLELGSYGLSLKKAVSKHCQQTALSLVHIT